MTPAETTAITTGRADQKSKLGRHKLPPAQPPWMLYGLLVCAAAAGSWALLIWAQSAQPDPVIPFQLPAARDDLPRLRDTYRMHLSSGLTSQDRLDLHRAQLIATQRGYAEMVTQLQAWGFAALCQSPSPAPAFADEQ